MRVGMACDHGGFELKARIASGLARAGHEVVDFGAFELDDTDDYPDFVIPLARAVSKGEVERGVAVCGSGVGASIAANKTPNVRAALISDHFSARQGVEDDDMNILCLGGRVVGHELAWGLVTAFLGARFSGAERHIRRLQKVAALEGGNTGGRRTSCRRGRWHKVQRGRGHHGRLLDRCAGPVLHGHIRRGGRPR